LLILHPIPHLITTTDGSRIVAYVFTLFQGHNVARSKETRKKVVTSLPRMKSFLITLLPGEVVTMARSFQLIATTGMTLERMAQDWPDALLLLAESGELQQTPRKAKRTIDLLNEKKCP
jgi:hypothetical protein